MILAIDIGNSNIVLGIFDEDTLLHTARIETRKHRSLDETSVIFTQILTLHGVLPKDIEGVIISSVVPELTDIVSSSINFLTLKNPLLVGPGIKTGLEILIDNPAQLGSDIVVDAVGAISKYPLPLIIFDMGTATTIGVINEKAQHLGCIIMPGVKISLEALCAKTSQLPHIGIKLPKKVIGTNTIDSMRSGIVFGTASMIDGMIDKIEKELNMSCTTIMTGGLSQEISQSLEHNIIHDKDLLLYGLFALYKKNEKN